LVVWAEAIGILGESAGCFSPALWKLTLLALAVLKLNQRQNA
jgi:hypothetical protein